MASAEIELAKYQILCFQDTHKLEQDVPKELDRLYRIKAMTSQWSPARKPNDDMLWHGGKAQPIGGTMVACHSSRAHRYKVRPRGLETAQHGEAPMQGLDWSATIIETKKLDFRS